MTYLKCILQAHTKLCQAGRTQASLIQGTFQLLFSLPPTLRSLEMVGRGCTSFNNSWGLYWGLNQCMGGLGCQGCVRTPAVAEPALAQKARAADTPQLHATAILGQRFHYWNIWEVLVWWEAGTFLPGRHPLARTSLYRLPRFCPCVKEASSCLGNRNRSKYL